MGLSVVYETVHRLQGDVNLKTKPGPGASFLLSVPLSVSTSHLLLLSAAGQNFRNPHARNREAVPHSFGTGGDAGRETGGEPGWATGPPIRIGAIARNRRASGPCVEGCCR